jgi:predicted transcriptional regulator
MSDEITPEELARELGLNGRTIRAYLREKHSAGHAPKSRWRLTDAQAQDVRSHFRHSSSR